MGILNVHGEFERDEEPRFMKLRHEDRAAMFQPKRKQRPTRTCPECGKPFSGRSDKTYCCESCRRRAAKRREHARRKASGRPD